MISVFSGYLCITEKDFDSFTEIEQIGPNAPSLTKKEKDLSY